MYQLNRRPYMMKVPQYKKNRCSQQTLYYNTNRNFETLFCPVNELPQFGILKKMVSFTSPGETFTRNPIKNLKLLTPSTYLYKLNQAYNDCSKKEVNIKNDRKLIMSNQRSNNNKSAITELNFGLYNETSSTAKKLNKESMLRRLMKNCTTGSPTRLALQRHYSTIQPKFIIDGKNMFIRKRMVNLKQKMKICSIERNKFSLL